MFRATTFLHSHIRQGYYYYANEHRPSYDCRLGPHFLARALRFRRADAKTHVKIRCAKAYDEPSRTNQGRFDQLEANIRANNFPSAFARPPMIRDRIPERTAGQESQGCQTKGWSEKEHAAILSIAFLRAFEKIDRGQHFLQRKYYQNREQCF